MYKTIMNLAYIDPGAGSLLLQMIIAGALGTLAFFRGSIARIFSLGKKDKEAPHEEEREVTSTEKPSD